MYVATRSCRSSYGTSPGHPNLQSPICPPPHRGTTRCKASGTSPPNPKPQGASRKLEFLCPGFNISVVSSMRRGCAAIVSFSSTAAEQLTPHPVPGMTASWLPARYMQSTVYPRTVQDVRLLDRRKPRGFTQPSDPWTVGPVRSAVASAVGRLMPGCAACCR